MDRFIGLLGIILIFGIAFLTSVNQKKIRLRIVIPGFILQILLALFILKTRIGQEIFNFIGRSITKILDFATEGGKFVFGVLIDKNMMAEIFGPHNAVIFIFTLIPTIIFVCVLVAIAYHIGLMQRIISWIAFGVYKLMRVSGSEALSNVASVFVGQVEAQIMIRPYIATMTRSELHSSMAGSMACIAGGIMAVYISMGIPANYLLTASLMAAPGALILSKIMFPETEKSQTAGQVNIKVEKNHVNLLDAIAHGASDGMRIAISVIAMLIGMIALISLLDGVLHLLGKGLVSAGVSPMFLGIELKSLSLKSIFGLLFSGIAFLMGVPWGEAGHVGALMGTKMVINEFVAYSDMTSLMASKVLSEKSVIIATFALCGFANFSSIAMQIGGIGSIVPERKADLAKLGFRAMICGTLASYLSATIAGILF